MTKTGKRGTAGFSLVEIIVAIAVLGLISAPVCASLVLAGRINAHSRAVMEAQLEVRTAVETLMEAGIEEAEEDYRSGDFPGVTVTTALAGPEDPYYSVTVSDEDKLDQALDGFLGRRGSCLLICQVHPDVGTND